MLLLQFLLAAYFLFYIRHPAIVEAVLRGLWPQIKAKDCANYAGNVLQAPI